ncbi:MAG: response regulator [Pyrinomonadaceae bacterium MAG19_C2-C3]|nr:response regulator [Pyrinomonadaceae bacterium MAG19_C2-C3]
MKEQGEYPTKILLIEEDDETRPLLKEMLQKAGYKMIVALDETDALERMREGNKHADLILVNMIDVTTDVALDAARRVRREAEPGDETLIVVMAESYGEELEGKDIEVSVGEYVTYPEDFPQLKNLLAHLLHQHSV